MSIATLILPLQDPVYAFSVLLVILLLAPLIAKPLKLPALVVLILLGCLLGSNGLGIIARDAQLIFLEKVGLLYIMLLAGLQMDLSDLQRLGMRALIFGLLTFGLPFAVGIVSGQVMISMGIIAVAGSSGLAAALLGILYSPHTLLAYPSMTRLGLAQRESIGVAVGGTVLTAMLTLVGFALIQAMAEGQIGLALWLKLLGGLPLLATLCFWGVPQLGRWFFNPTAEVPLGLQFIFVVATLFVIASATQGLGVDSIVGAFIAGLALNRSIPIESDLMNRIDFVGNSLFIPAFMVSVGVLANPKVFVSAPGSLGIAGVIIGGAVASKWISAWLIGRWFDYEPMEVWTLFSLTIPRAALVLVITLFGKEAGLVDDNIFNAVIAYIVVTCLLGPILSEWAGQKLATQLEG
ncbi:cation:proton antiporter [Acaryochloris sp. 'Moss Beach']|uniref:cation:proton antiporter n=1 Tax=Acaryochloris sp. 'Moss Beach' TaxID=2740837 RepID=UPI001F4399FB|nr:cation:proton antiporter [Acaryochloris sp. 'Moss Beach']UJB71409.1 cation:proton antiporter [Acaryochloris sp. 'Moss Beach']